MYNYGFPAWFGLIALIFLYLETRKQYRRYFKKGSAMVLGKLWPLTLAHAPGVVNPRGRLWRGRC